MTFYSAWYCPFAQRAWMTLLLKQIDFEYIEVDPFLDSKWWRTISRGQSLVPVLVSTNGDQFEEITIVDSTRVVEYLDEVVPSLNPLMAGNPDKRAEQRWWMDYVNNEIVPHLYRHLMAAKADEQRYESKNTLLDGLQKIASAMSSDGPFFNGSKMTVVDILLAPMAYRIDTVLRHYRDFGIPAVGEEWSRYHRWYQAMLSEPVFRTTSTDFENYRQRLIEFYLPFSQGKGQQDLVRKA